MRYLGNGRYQDADGRVYEHDPGEYDPTPCRGCEDEFADDEEDGLCSFCREDAELAKAIAKRELDRRAANRARLQAWVNADPERRKAAEDCQRRIQELRRVG